MASNVLDLADAPDEPRLVPAARARGLRAGPVVLAPAVAAAVALAVHQLVPHRQELPMTWMDSLPAWKHPYPLLLDALLAASLLVAVAQAAWRPLRPWVLHHGPLWAGFFVTLCVWDLITKRANLPQGYFPGPDGVLGGMIDDYPFLLLSAWHSLRLLTAGYALGVAAGLVTGVLIGWFLSARYWIMPALKFVGPIPATALVPLVMTLFPGSFLGGAALIGFAVWFPVTMFTSSGIANVRISYLDVARTLGAGRLYLIFRVAFPAALPNVFLGLFMGLGASFLTLIVAETLGVQAGLGYYLKWQQGYGEFDKVYASLVIMALFFSALMTLLFKVRDRVLKWQKGVIKW